MQPEDTVAESATADVSWEQMDGGRKRTESSESQIPVPAPLGASRRARSSRRDSPCPFQNL